MHKRITPASTGGGLASCGKLSIKHRVACKLGRAETALALWLMK